MPRSEKEIEIAEIKDALAIKESLVVRNGVYFSGDDGPFCTRCWDVTSKLVLLQVRRNKYANCPECNTTFQYLGQPMRPYAR